MGLFDSIRSGFESVGNTIGHAASEAGGAIAGAATTAAGAVAHAGETAGVAIGDTAKTGANTIANGVVNGAEAALEAMDPERKKQRERMQQAQQEWKQLDDEANQALAAAQTQAQAQITAQLDPIIAQASKFSSRLDQFKAEADTLHASLQTHVGPSYNQVLMDLSAGCQSLTRLAMILRGHSVEQIRDAKIAEGGKMGPNDFLLQVIEASQESFAVAMTSAASLSSLVQNMTVQVRDLDQAEIPKLLADMTAFGKFNSESVTGFANSAATASASVTIFQNDIQQQKQEVTDHLHMNITDDLAGIGKAILDAFGKSFPDGWDSFLQSHYAAIQGFNTSLVEAQTTAAVANGIVAQVTPVLDQVSSLQTQTAGLNASLLALAPGLETLKSSLSSLRIQVDDAAQVFSTIAESTHFGMSTTKYISKLAAIGTTCSNIDGCVTNPAAWMIGQLMQIVITTADNQTFAAGDAPDNLFADWQAGLREGLHCSLPAVAGLQHDHFFPEVNKLFADLQAEVDRVTQGDLTKYYTP